MIIWLLLHPHNAVGGAAVDPEHSFSAAGPHTCSLSLLWFLPSAADEATEEEKGYEKDGFNAISRRGWWVNSFCYCSLTAVRMVMELEKRNVKFSAFLPGASCFVPLEASWRFCMRTGRCKE